MPRNIFIIGAQCTGKTTLIEALLKSDLIRNHAEGPLEKISEVAREVIAKEGYSSSDFGSQQWNELQRLILKAQRSAQEAMAGKCYISDRSAIDPLVYTKLNDGDVQSLLSSKDWTFCRSAMQEALVVLCEAGNETWLSSDGVRVSHSSAEEWIGLNKMFEQLLQLERIAYSTMPADMTSLDDRVAFIHEQVFGQKE